MIESGGSGIGKAAEQLTQELQRSQQDLQNKAPGQAPGAPSDGFQQALQDTKPVQATTQVHDVTAAHHATHAAGVLSQARLLATSPSVRVNAAATAERSQMAQMLDQLVGGQDKMGDIMKLALSGKQFNAQELLAMQAGVYRFSQELDLTGKVIEKATSGIKQTMNTQV